MINKIKSLVLVLTAACFAVVIILRLLCTTTVQEILAGGFLVLFLCSYIVITIIEELPFFRAQKLWLDNNRFAFGWGFLLFGIVVFEMVFFAMEPTSEWEQILRVFVMSILGVGGILIGYGLLTNRFVRD
jgi:hypothetical protein